MSDVWEVQAGTSPDPRGFSVQFKGKTQTYVPRTRPPQFLHAEPAVQRYVPLPASHPPPAPPRTLGSCWAYTDHRAVFSSRPVPFAMEGSRFRDPDGPSSVVGGGALLFPLHLRICFSWGLSVEWLVLARWRQSSLSLFGTCRMSPGHPTRMPCTRLGFSRFHLVLEGGVRGAAEVSLPAHHPPPIS